MKPPPFAYHRPHTVDEAAALLAEHGDEARVLAGGQSLVPMMNFRLARPSVLVDLDRVEELSFIEPAEGGGVRIGAMTRQRELERDPLVRERAPLVFETAPHIAHPQIRNRGTVGGSVAHADPAAELPAVMVARGARFRVRGQDGDRWVDATEFFRGLFSTALEPGELLAEIELPPLPPGTGWAFEEVARRHGDFALVGVAALVAVGAEGRCSDARIAYLSVGPGPVLAGEAAGCLIGAEPGGAASAEAARVAAARDVDPVGDIHASADYRRHLVEVLTRRALVRAFARARGEGTPS